MVRHIKVVLQVASLPLTGSTCTETLDEAAADGSADKKQKKPIIDEHATNARNGVRKCKPRCELQQREFDCMFLHRILISQLLTDGFGAAVTVRC